VLILDNDPAILQGMEALLERWSYRVLTAPSLDALTARIAQGQIAQGAPPASWPPALIIADYHLDDGQLGDDAIAALRDRLGTRTPALIISADRSEEVKAKVQGAGLAMLHKPVKPAQLRALMRTLMS
jgi:DNA-binding response OmpR family regulator